MVPGPRSAGRLLATALLLCGCALQAHAQQPVPEIPVEAELVRLDVVVTDTKHQPVAGLGQGDFAVFEDGKAQEVAQFEAFERVRQARREAGPAPESRSETVPTTKARPRRHVVLAIDDLHISLGDLVQVKEALFDFVERELGPEDATAVVATSGALGVTQQFTGDVELLRRAIARVTPKPLQTWPGVPHITRYQAELIVRGDPDALDLAVEEIGKQGLRVLRPEEMARTKARGIFKESADYAHATLGTLDSMMRGLAEVPGRKVVVLVSDGFLLGLGVSGGVDYDLRRVVDAATRAGIVVYTLDTRGLLATTEDERPESVVPRSARHPGLRQHLGRQAEHAERDGLNAVAEGTGGFLVYGVNDLGAGLSRIARDTETYYLLAYAPTNTKHDGKFRKIEVRLPGHPELKVRTRTGYFAPDDRQAKDRKESEKGGAARELQAALFSLYPRTGIPVRLAADFVSLGDAGEQMMLTANVDLGAARFRREGKLHRTRLVLVGTVFDAAGLAAVNLDPQALDLTFTETQLQQAQREGLKYEKALALSPGAYEARMAVWDETSGRLGSASVRVTLPDLTDGQLRIAGPVLMRAFDEDADGPGTVTLRQVLALPRYRRGESLYYQLQVLNAAADDSGARRVTIQAEVLQGGEVKGTTAEERLETRQEGPLPPAFASQVSLGGLEPGDYQLRVVVTDQVAGTRVDRAVAFTVEPWAGSS